MGDKTVATADAAKLTSAAHAAYATVMAAGHAGVSAADLRAAHPGVGSDPAGFVEKHAGLTLRKEGGPGAERYFVVASAASD